MFTRMTVLGALTAVTLSACGSGTPPPAGEAEAATAGAHEPEGATVDTDATAPAAEAASHAGQQLVEERCVVCHGLDVVYGDSHDREEWAEVVREMVGRGARLDAGEVDLVVDYLATR